MKLSTHIIAKTGAKEKRELEEAVSSYDHGNDAIRLGSQQHHERELLKCLEKVDSLIGHVQHQFAICLRAKMHPQHSGRDHFENLLFDARNALQQGEAMLNEHPECRDRFLDPFSVRRRLIDTLLKFHEVQEREQMQPVPV